MKEKYPEITKEIVQNMYIEQKMTMRQIAEHFNCTEITIQNKIKRFGLRKKQKSNYIHQEFGYLYVQEYAGRNKFRNQYKCLCKCGKTIIVDSCSLITGNTKSCGCYKESKGIRPYTKNPDIVINNGDKSHLWKGCGDISGSYFCSVRYSARCRKIEFNITIEYIAELFEKQDKKCTLSGILLIAPIKHNEEFTASLDRIDSSKGYIEGNVQWIHKDFQPMKGSYSEEYFIEMCRLVTKHKEIR